MVGRRARPVADDLHAANHLANGEEAKDLGGNDTGRSELRPVHIPDAGQEVGGLAGELGGVLEGVEEGLEVGLESLRGPARVNEYGPFRRLYPGIAYGGLILRAWKTILPSSSATRE